MSTRAARVTGTVLSLAVVSAWSFAASLAIGPSGPLYLGADLAADHARLASAPAGNGPALFAVVAVIYAACLLVPGWRQRRDGGG